MDSLSEQDRKQSERGAVKALKEARLKVGFSDDLRLVVSLDLFVAMQADTASLIDSDWNVEKAHHEWQGLPVITDRRLKDLKWEFVKVWTPKLQNSVDNLPWPLLRTTPSIKEPSERRERGKAD